MRSQLAKRALPPVVVASVVAIALSTASDARAQDCERMSGPARTDCFSTRARILGQQSGIAVSAARVRSSAERLRAVTGGSYEPMRHKAKSRHKVRRN